MPAPGRSGHGLQFLLPCGHLWFRAHGGRGEEHGGGVQPAPPEDHCFLNADHLPILGAVPGDPGRELGGGNGD